MAKPTRTEFNRRTRQLVSELRDHIYSSRIEAGRYLPSELKLGEQYGLSKESVRRALDELIDDGLITKVRRVGNRVNPSSQWVRETARTANGTPIDNGRTPLRFAYHSSLLNEIPLQQLVAAFEKENPGVDVQMMPTAFPIDYASRGLADVVTITAWDTMKHWNDAYHTSLGHLSSPPYEEAANPMLKEPFLNPYSSGEERMIATPFLFSPLVLCYNRKHFIECGLSEPDGAWTWYTLLNTARQLARQLDVWGFATHIQSINRWPVFLLQNGFRFRQEERGQRAAEDPALWESLRVARDLVHKQGRATSLWTEENSDVEQMLREGNASMILTTYYGLNRLRDSSIDYALAPLPTLANSDTLLLVTGLSIHKDSPRQELAKEFVRCLSSFEAQALIRRQTLSLPAHAEALALADGLAGNRPRNEELFASLWPRCRQYADLGLDADTIGAIRSELKAYWSRMEDEEEASARLDTLLRDARPLNAAP